MLPVGLYKFRYGVIFAYYTPSIYNGSMRVVYRDFFYIADRILGIPPLCRSDFSRRLRYSAIYLPLRRTGDVPMMSAVARCLEWRWPIEARARLLFLSGFILDVVLETPLRAATARTIFWGRTAPEAARVGGARELRRYIQNKRFGTGGMLPPTLACRWAEFLDFLRRAGARVP